MLYIDIHTHKIKCAQNPSLSVLNVFPADISSVSKSKFVTLGIHPWYISEAEANLKTLSEYVFLPNVIAVGETGLDKLRPDFEKQIDVFRAHIRIAQQVHKPLIIHCVRAYQEVTELLLSEKFELPVIFHWFSGSPQLAKQLTDKCWFLSFGQSLFDLESKTVRAFKAVPLEFIFFETDDSDYEISEIYEQAAFLRNCTAENLSDSISKNFQRFFQR